MEERDGIKELIRGANDIVDVVASSGVELKRKGHNYFALCPFHEEKTPSFIVNPERQTYKCFGCGEGGDVFSFIEKTQRLTFPEALRHLAERCGMQMPVSKEESSLVPLYECLEAACQLFQDQLPGSEAEAYLERRKFSRKAIEKWRLGYARSSWDFLMQSLTEQGFKIEDLANAGLVVSKETDQQDRRNCFDFFRNRVMFPIMDSRGKIVGFGARTLLRTKEEMRAQKVAKYMNTRETVLYKKSESLFGLNFAVDAIRKSREIYVVEGYTDVIQAQESGIENTVGVIGTSFTQDHADIIERRFPNTKIICCYDGDEGGKRAAHGTAKNILGRLNAGICILSEGKDPADIIEGGGDLESELQKDVSLFDFVFNEVSRKHNLDTPEGKTAALNDIEPYLVNVPEDRLGIYLDTLRQRLQVNVDSVKVALTEKRKDRKEFSQAKAAGFGRVKNIRSAWETEFIKILLSIDTPETLDYLSQELNVQPQDFNVPEVRAVYNHLVSDRESLFQCAAMPLVAAISLEDLIGYICGEAQESGIELDKETMRSFFPKQKRQHELDELDEAYLMIRSFDLGSRVRSAIKSRKSSKSLVKYMKKTMEDLEDI